MLGGLGLERGIGRQRLAPIGFVATAGHGGQAGCAQCGGGVGALRALQRGAQGAGQQLGPGVAARATADQGKGGLGIAPLPACCAHGVEAIEQAKAHALHHGIGEIGRVVLGPQAHENAGSRRVVVRGAFTTQVGQKQRGLGLAAGGQGTHGGRQLGLVTPASQAGDPAKGTGRAEHDGHVVPALRQRMGKGVHGALGGGGKGIGHPKHHTRGPQRYKALPGGARAHAHGAGGVVARACRHDHAFAQPPAAGYVAQQRAGGGVALGQGGHVRGIQPAGLQHGRAPGAGLHIQPQGAGCIGHIADRRASELQAQPVFGQQHGADLGKHGRLMRAQP